MTIGISLQIARDICKQFESFRSKPYLDYGGVPTIGYGTVWKQDGTKVTINDQPIDQRTAELWMINKLSTELLPGVLKASPILIGYPEALGAIMSFSYNLGLGRYRASTLRKRIEQEDWQGARDEILKWNKDSGVVLRGLTLRRMKESSYLGC